jgi:UDP-2-acetamido-2,6-beta-L-arabino-hexul-4-ose reductase
MSKKTVLITGADGFIGKNLAISLERYPNVNILKYTRSTDADLAQLVSDSDIIFHLAGINRPKHEREFKVGNSDLTQQLCEAVKAAEKPIPLILTSSIQIEKDSSYGKSKLLAELHVLNLYAETNNPVFIYRLPNVFGKWCKPNYNSVVATFCYNIANGLPLEIHDPSHVVDLLHIGDLVHSFIGLLEEVPKEQIFISLDCIYRISVLDLANIIRSFKEDNKNITVDEVGVGFKRLLYATYLSYLNPLETIYPLKRHADDRGAFVEMLRTKSSGQFSYFTARPGVTRGGHYHNVKTEKFLVVNGLAKFRFQHILTDEIIEFEVNSDKPQIVETIPGWSHDITNIGECDLIALLWANEVFDMQRPDTNFYPIHDE